MQLSAEAISKPTMPVPGMPTPMAFFKMLVLTHSAIFSGRQPSVSVAFATASATAIGSVQPSAGLISRCSASRYF